MRLLWLAFSLSVVPMAASAVPLDIAGFGDSITCDTCNDGSYLSLLGAHLPEVPIIQDEALTTLTSGAVLSTLEAWLDGGGSADWVIIMAGTVDVYQEVGGFNNVEYSEAQVVSNLDDMIDLVLSVSMSVVVVAPPPVQSPCGGAGVVITCTDIDNRLNSLSAALAGLANSKSVPFVDLYDAYINHPDWDATVGSASLLFTTGGLVPQYTTGDDLSAFEIASAINEAPEPDPPAVPSLPITGMMALLGLLGATAYLLLRRHPRPTLTG